MMPFGILSKFGFRIAIATIAILLMYRHDNRVYSYEESGYDASDYSQYDNDTDFECGSNDFDFDFFDSDESNE